MAGFFDALRATMVGHAVADALGVPAEFSSRAALCADPVVGMRGFGAHKVPAGTWSDDTSMALAALDSLASGRVDYGEIMENFARWYREAAYTATDLTFDIGGTCLWAIGAHLADPDLPAYECGGTDVRSNGNGSLMRIHPFVLYAYARELPKGEWHTLIRRGSALTHAHERSVLGCLIYAYVLREILDDPCREAILRGLRQAGRELAASPEIAHYARLLAGGFAALPCGEISSSGYVVDSLEAAIWCLLNTEDYRTCVLTAVNLGEDTDTVAAIAGSLAGPLYGYEAIPAEWREALLRREVIEEMCTRAYMKWKM